MLASGSMGTLKTPMAEEHAGSQTQMDARMTPFDVGQEDDQDDSFELDDMSENFLPDESWIAVVCGVAFELEKIENKYHGTQTITDDVTELKN